MLYISQPSALAPAMEAGLSDHVWTIAELVGLLEHNEAEVAA